MIYASFIILIIMFALFVFAIERSINNNKKGGDNENMDKDNNIRINSGDDNRA